MIKTKLVDRIFLKKITTKQDGFPAKFKIKKNPSRINFICVLTICSVSLSGLEYLFWKILR